MDERINVPDQVDEFNHYLIWQLDEIVFVLFGLILGIMFRQPFFGFIGGLFIRSMYIKVRDDKPNGYLVHRIREMGLLPQAVTKGTSHQPALVDEYTQ